MQIETTVTLQEQKLLEFEFQYFENGKFTNFKFGFCTF